MNPHLDYLLKRFREERAALRLKASEIRGDTIARTRILNRIDEHLDEIEYQIRRAFDDQEKEAKKTRSTLDRV